MNRKVKWQIFGITILILIVEDWIELQYEYFVKKQWVHKDDIISALLPEPEKRYVNTGPK